MSKPAIISKEMIDETAFALVQEGGIDALSVRNIAHSLGCSTKPIYRVYGSMEELRKNVYEKIALYMSDMLHNYRKSGNSILDLGVSYVLCAMREKNLFLYLCQTTTHPKSNLSGILNDRVRKLYGSSIDVSELSDKKLEQMSLHCGLFVFGLAISCCYGIFSPTEDRIQTILQDFLDTQKKGI